MAIRPSVPEIITVNSEELQALIRDLLPSQNGFGSELQASNVITPIIDLTATAEGSTLRSDLQTALAFGSQTAFSANNGTDVIANSPGFYRIVGCCTVGNQATGIATASLDMSDGLSTKTVWEMSVDNDPDKVGSSENIDFTVFLAAGESISAVSSSVNSFLIGSSRQIASGDGTFVQPSGFPL